MRDGCVSCNSVYEQSRIMMINGRDGSEDLFLQSTHVDYSKIMICVPGWGIVKPHLRMSFVFSDLPTFVGMGSLQPTG